MALHVHYMLSVSVIWCKMKLWFKKKFNNNNNIHFLETHNTIKNSFYACEKSKYQTEIMIFQN